MGGGALIDPCCISQHSHVAAAAAAAVAAAAAAAGHLNLLQPTFPPGCLILPAFSAPDKYTA